MSQRKHARKRKYARAVVLLSICIVIGSSVLVSAARDKKAERTAYNYLVQDMGLNAAAACGIMANIYGESNFSSTVWDRTGSSYGICQWLGSRLTSLYSFCSSNGLESSDLVAQLKFMEYELENIYPSTYQSIRNVSNDSSGAYDAAYTFCYEFERPANKAYRSDERGGFAKTIYWPEYGAEAVILEVDSVEEGNKLVWTTYSGKTYQIYRSGSENGTFKKIGTASDAGSGSWVDTKAKKGVLYFYQLRAKSAPKNTAYWSSVVSCIRDASLEDDECSISLVKTEFVYNGKARTPRVTVKYGDQTLEKGKDYTVTYKKNVNAGKNGTVTVTGIGSYSGTRVLNIWIKKANQKLSTGTLYIPYHANSDKIDVGQLGKSITMKSSAGSIVSVRGQKLRGKKYGTASITIRAAGTVNYKPATVTVKAVVVPPAPRITSLSVIGYSGELANIRMKWKAAGKAEGFEIQYTNGTSFSQGKETKTIKSAKQRSLKISELDEDRLWRFRIRSYKKTGGKKRYSAWSEVKLFGGNGE